MALQERPHHIAETSSHCAAPAEHREASSTSRCISSTTPSRNEKISFEQTAPSSHVPQRLNTARPPSPSAGAITAAGASSSRNRLADRRAEQVQRDDSRAAAPSRARRSRSGTVRSTAPLVPRLGAELGLVGGRPVARFFRAAAQHVEQPDLVFERAVSLIELRCSPLAGSARNSSPFVCASRSNSALWLPIVARSFAAISMSRRYPAAGPLRWVVAPAHVAELHVAPRSADRAAEDAFHAFARTCGRDAPGVPATTAPSVPRLASLAQAPSAPTVPSGLTITQKPAQHHHPHQHHLAERLRHLPAHDPVVEREHRRHRQRQHQPRPGERRLGLAQPLRHRPASPSC